MLEDLHPHLKMEAARSSETLVSYCNYMALQPGRHQLEPSNILHPP